MKTVFRRLQRDPRGSSYVTRRYAGRAGNVAGEVALFLALRMVILGTGDIAASIALALLAVTGFALYIFLGD